MLAGWLSSGVEPKRFAVLDPGLDAAPSGVALYRDVSEVTGSYDALLLGFKPQQLGRLAPDLQPLAGDPISVHSLLAGITLDQLQATFPDARAHVRVMPNLAARIGKSPVILLERGQNGAERDTTFALYDRLGQATWLADERQFDLVTALTGSGPGFVYRFIAALAEAAGELGLEREQADMLALSMVEGAASLAAQAEVGAQASPAELADRVASAGGMTRAGLDVLDADGALVRLLTDALAATRDRGAKLSDESG